jgi:hypothetical protein
MTRGVEDDDGTAVSAQALERTTCTSVHPVRKESEVAGQGMGLTEEKVRELLEEWE